ncbi:hypothetical protein [Malikia spinosa]|uniref:hypothetical protein n=1 Tax=Malikia spinosa TaxID=86180 RepID=UPI002FDABDA8
MDDIDRAQEREAKDRELCLAQRKPQLIPCGVCFNYSEPVEGRAEFCDAYCREDYEARDAAMLRAGR